jgi:hypothetical protein
VHLDKTRVIKFNLNYLQNESHQLFYKDKLITEVINTKFLGFEIYEHMNEKNHTGHIWPKLSSACYEIRCIISVISKPCK